MSNSLDPDDTVHYEPSYLDLCCLQKPIIIACGKRRVNISLGKGQMDDVGVGVRWYQSDAIFMI